MTRSLAWSRRFLPRGWVDAVRQVALFAAAYLAYRFVRGLIDGQVSDAFANARALVDAERAMGLFFEPGLQRWTLDEVDWLVDVANWLYVNTHFTITTTFLLWLYIARNDAFYFVRNMFLISMGLALVGYVVFPTAPPRLLPEWGFTDTVALAVGQGGQDSASVLYNPYAAVPSMHVAFALMIGLPAMKLVRHRVLRIGWGAYPGLVTLVVVLTANHFWLDAVLGVMVAAASAYMASAGLARARPEAWSWREALGAKAAA